MEGLELLLAWGMGFIVIALIFIVASYVVNGLFYTKLAKDNEVEGAWMAWVPFANNYFHGKVASQMTNDPQYLQYYTIAYIGYLITSFLNPESFILSLIILVVNLCFLVLLIMGLQKIYKRYIPNSATLLACLSFIPFVQLITMIYLMTSKIGKTYN